MYLRFIFLFSTLGILMSCQTQRHYFDKAIYKLPSDSLAEISRYTVKTIHYGVPLTGKATLVIVNERLNKDTYVKTNKTKNSMGGVKMMFIQNISSMNWDNNDNIALYSDSNLNPLRLSITSEEWCGNNYLEIRRKGDSFNLLGRPYTDDIGILDETKSINNKVYFYDQLPILVRAIIKNKNAITVNVIAQQTAYLKPHTNTLSLKFEVVKKEKLTLKKKTYHTIKVKVTSTRKSKYWPQPEYYWLSTKNHIIVKSIRNFLSTQMGKFHIASASYTLDDHQRIEYWGKPLSPSTNKLNDKKRATISSYVAINISKWLSTKKKDKKKYNLEDFLKGKNLPKEYISNKDGDNKFYKSYTGNGGWYFDTKENVLRPNVPPF